MSNKKIGITEGGDAGLNFKWVRALREDFTLDGAVIITKCLNEEMLEPLLEHKDRVILHVTVTGYAGTVIEPNTPSVKSVKVLLKELREKGFPAEHLVLRIDPIIPSEKGIRKADRVFQFFAPLVSRVRISIIDMYPAVRERFHDAGLPSPYGREFAPSMAQINAVNKLIKSWKTKYPEMKIEVCAEPGLHDAEYIGCISRRDYDILGVPMQETVNECKARETCLCVNKKELLSGKHRCPNRCLYCYWKDADSNQMEREDEILLK